MRLQKEQVTEKPPAILGRYEIIVIVLLLLGLYLSSRYSYLLFHSLAELFAIVIALAVFVVAWNSRQFVANNYLLFIGIAFLFIVIIDIAHTLAFKGMNIFQGYDANLPTQLWIAARYMQALSLLVAPMFLQRRLRLNIVIPAYAAVTILVLMSVFYWQNFPTCYIEGVGLTSFKKISEYIICAILLGSIGTLYWKRKEFDKEVFRLLVAAIAFTIASELMFTFYVGVYDISNLGGHIFRIVVYYLIYKAIVETGLMRPYQFLFRDLKQNEQKLTHQATELTQANTNLEQEIKERKTIEEELRRHRFHLEDLVAERTAQLEDINKQMREQARSAQLLRDTATAINEASHLGQALQAILDAVCHYAGFPVGHAYLKAEDSNELASAKIWHLDDPDQFEAFRTVTEAHLFTPNIGLQGRVYQNKKPAWIVDVNNDPNFPRAKMGVDIGTKAGFAFPVLVGSDVVAIMEFFHPEAIEPDESLLELMKQVGMQLGRAFERDRATKDLEESFHKVRQALDGVVSATSRAMESRDPYTGGHQKRVAQLSCAIAEEMGLTEDRIAGIRMAATIHDIGKISVPAEILTKPGKISEIEFGIIKQHAQTGYDILGDIEFPWPVAQVAYQHHERLDDSGYPQGLTADSIILEAKIVAVADVVEAMASHRPYRPALGIDKALEEISQKKGTIYDSQVVDACLRLFAENKFKFD